MACSDIRIYLSLYSVSYTVQQMKNALLTVLFLTSFKAHAVFWIQIVNPCVNVASIYEEVDVFAPATVSDVVRFFFPAFEIPYVATETSMVHIFNTPVGKEAIEIVNENHYRVYGWCYEVDGVMPNVTMDQFTIDPVTTEEVRWFYGFAEQINGKWVNYCEPLYNHPEQFICAGLFN